MNKLSHTTAFPDNVVPAAIPGVTDILLRVMENVYAVLGVGLGSANQPSRENWSGRGPGVGGTRPRANRDGLTADPGPPVGPGTLPGEVEGARAEGREFRPLGARRW